VAARAELLRRRRDPAGPEADHGTFVPVFSARSPAEPTASRFAQRGSTIAHSMVFFLW